MDTHRQYDSVVTAQIISRLNEQLSQADHRVIERTEIEFFPPGGGDTADWGPDVRDGDTERPGILRQAVSKVTKTSIKADSRTEKTTDVAIAATLKTENRLTEDSTLDEKPGKDPYRWRFITLAVFALAVCLVLFVRRLRG